MECDICLGEWDSNVKIPRLLYCGHTFCQVCLIELYKKISLSKNEFTCPSCNTLQKEIEKEEDVTKLIKNFNLLRIVDKIEKRMSTSLLSKSASDNNKSIMMTEPFIKEKQSEDFLRSENNCKKHNMKAYFYAIGTKMLFCELCKNETSLKLFPFPGVIKDFKRKCSSIQTTIDLLTKEIERLNEFFKSYEVEFLNENKRKIDSLFEYIYKIVQFNYNSSIHILNQCHKEQNHEISTRILELNEMKSELDKYQMELNTIVIEEEREILNSNEKVNKIKSKLDYFLNYSSELNLLTMKIDIKDEIKSNLINVLQNSYELDIEFASIKGEKPLIKHILRKDKFWVCICGESNNPIIVSQCIFCGLLRKIESFHNILTSPEEVSNEEIGLLNLRRKEECKIFQQEINRSILKEEDKYAIDMEWFLLWKSFVMNDFSEKYISNCKKNISINTAIGVLHPGPITNYSLLEKGVKDCFNKRLKKGLKKNEDYLILNKNLWFFLNINYGGGPEITLNKNEDFYSSSIKFTPDNFSNSIKKGLNSKENQISSLEIIVNKKEDEYSMKQIVTVVEEYKEEKSTLKEEAVNKYPGKPLNKSIEKEFPKILFHDITSRQEDKIEQNIQRRFPGKSISPNMKK